MAISKETALNMLVWFKEVLDDEYGAEFARLSTLGSGEQNVIENISIDGTIQPIDATKTANLNLSAYYKKSELAGALSTVYILNETINNLSGYELKPATTSELGGIIVGSGLSITGEGVLSAIPTSMIVDYESLKPANTTELGGIIVGDGLSITDEGLLSAIIQGGGQSSIIDNISIDGTIQPVVKKIAILGLSAYAKKNEIGSGIRIKGSVYSFANLPENALVGDLYNIRTAGVDNEGNAIRAGDNVVFTEDGTWNVMAGFVDTSNYVTKVALKQLSTEDFTSEEKNKLAELRNYKLPTASKTLLGGVMIGAGLSMVGDTLNAISGDIFKGATATETGNIGLVHAPAAGYQKRFLRGDANWRNFPNENINLLISGGSSDAINIDVSSYPLNTQGALYMDNVQDEYFLKLHSGNNDYTFKPDLFTTAIIKPPPPADFVTGKIYYLNTAPSSVNGELWYTADAEGMTTLCAHRQDSNYSFDFTYNYDLINEQYDTTNLPTDLYSYMPLKTSTRDLLNRAWTTSITEPVIEKTDFGIYALRNMDKSLTNTVATNSGWALTGLAKYTFTIDFWLSWNADTSEEKTAVIGKENTFYSIVTLSTNGTYACSIGVYNNSLVKRVENFKTYPPFDGFENIFEDDAPKRVHIALTHASSSSSTGAAMTVYINGKNQGKFQYGYSNGSSYDINFNKMTALRLLPYVAGTETEYRGLYIDHFRIWNSAKWSSDFPTPTESDYPVW